MIIIDEDGIMHDVVPTKVLEQIRDEIAQLHSDMNVINYNLAIGNVLDIIDKYMK